MTREKYESLPLATLKELAKARKMKGVSTLKKADLIEAMISLDEQEDQEKLSEQKESSQEHLKEMQNQNREEKAASELKENKEHREAKDKKPETDMEQLDSGCSVSGILEVMPDGFGFIRSDNYLPGENDVYVSPAQIRRFGLKTGDILSGNTRIKTQSEKFSALLYVTTVNGYHPAEAAKRPNFEELTPIFPKDRIRLEQPGSSTAMRIMDLISPIGKGQRGMIVSPPKAGKTTLLKCMIGLLSWSSGHSLLNGQYIQQLKAKEIWNTISYIPQTHGFSFSYTGLEMVMMGRSSHLGLFEQPGTKEIEMAESRILPRRIVTA